MMPVAFIAEVLLRRLHIGVGEVPSLKSLAIPTGGRCAKPVGRLGRESGQRVQARALRQGMREGMRLHTLASLPCCGVDGCWWLD